jgi:hypothetical protein
MGMYTGLRFRGYIKPEYRQMIQEILGDYDNWQDRKHWEHYIEQFPFLENFATLPRASMIPFGGHAYMPDVWDNKENIVTSSFKRQFDMETGYFAFSCSLKNYDDEIDTFISEVIPIMCESTDHIEEFYEEWHESNLYALKDGLIVDAGHISYYDESYDDLDYNYWWRPDND